MASQAHNAASATDSMTPKSVWEKSRYDTSLGFLTRRFAELLRRSSDGVLDLNLVAQELNAPKRRVYDVTNVLEGIQLIKKKSKNYIQWMGGQTSAQMDQELNDLNEEEKKLDELIQSCTWQVHQMCENHQGQRFAYLTYEDVRRLPNLEEQTVIVIKAPAETKLAVPHPEESLQVHLCSTQGPIEVFLCSDDPGVPMEDTLGPLVNCSSLSSTNGTAYSTSGINSICNPLSATTKHSSPVSDRPVDTMTIPHVSPSEDEQSFVCLTSPLAFSLDGKEYFLSLAKDESITDLFNSAN
ncbi:transcription factor E2F3 [Labrus bergylta]|uniref:transcription factor E2F3 n=1 Tax=Labrus bergylta TaxID=56723 RepID=UPI00331363E9